MIIMFRRNISQAKKFSGIVVRSVGTFGALKKIDNNKAFLKSLR